MIKQGESLFIPFLNGVGVRDAHQKARTYKSIDACRKALKRDFDKVEIVEYAPVRHGEWERMDEYCNHSKEFKCTACKQSVFYDHFTRFCEYEYCPNCGARMDAKEDAHG